MKVGFFPCRSWERSPLTGAVSAHEISFLSPSLSLLMGCLLIEAVLENSGLFRVPSSAFFYKFTLF